MAIEEQQLKSHQAQQNAFNTGVKATLKAGRILFLLLKTLLGPYLLPLLIILLLVIFLYASMFIVPLSIQNQSDGKLTSIFSGGTENTMALEFDQQLREKYEKLGNRWHEKLESEAGLRSRLGSDWAEDIHEGYFVSQHEQAEPYRLPWAILAGIDRVAGDPLMNEEGEYRPQPTENFEALKPVFEWEEVEFAKKIEYEDEEPDKKENSDGNNNSQEGASGSQDEKTEDDRYEPEAKTVIKTRTERIVVPLLKRAETYQATYEFEYEDFEVIRGTENHDQRITKGKTLKSISEQGPYFGSFINLLNKHGIEKDIDVETVLQLAMTYDPTYKADMDLLGVADYGFDLDLTERHWEGPTGERAIPLPLKYMNAVTSPYGWRIHPVYKSRRFHTGLDLAAPKGTPVYSFENGMVVYAGYYGAFGKTVIVDHGEIKTMYAHLSRFSVEKSDEVNAGDKLGEVGTSGTSTGYHLHFEIKKLEDGAISTVNPVNYLQN